MKNTFAAIKFWMDKILSIACAVLLTFMTVLVLIQVFSRYILNSPVAFTEELVRYSLIWTGFIGAAFLLNGCLLYASDRIVPGRGNERSMRIRDALLIGCAQAVATIPGISRSGSTITAGIATGQSRPFAMKYSLLMSIPAVLGANLLSLIKALKAGVEWSNFPAYLIGMIVSIVVGYFSIILLQRLLKKGKFGNFAYYMWGVGVVTLIASLF